MEEAWAAMVTFLAEELQISLGPDGLELFDANGDQIQPMIMPDGDGWAFYVLPDDTTSYVHADLTIEWYGTAWCP